jgi:hypothetical protein
MSWPDLSLQLVHERLRRDLKQPAGGAAPERGEPRDLGALNFVLPGI